MSVNERTKLPLRLTEVLLAKGFQNDINCNLRMPLGFSTFPEDCDWQAQCSF